MELVYPTVRMFLIDFVEIHFDIEFHVFVQLLFSRAISNERCLE